MRRRKTTCFFALVLAVLSAVCIVRFMIPRASIFNVSAVETSVDIGVYWDAKCTLTVNSIDWGNLSHGELKKVIVYVRNNGNESFFLGLKTANWNPSSASQYLMFSWSCERTKIAPREVVKVTQSLFVSLQTSGISSFSFDIIFQKRESPPADINKDGVVDMRDVGIACAAFGSRPGDSNWNSDADLNQDGTVNMRDIGLVTVEFGKSG